MKWLASIVTWLLCLLLTVGAALVMGMVGAAYCTFLILAPLLYWIAGKAKKLT